MSPRNRKKNIRYHGVQAIRREVAANSAPPADGTYPLVTSAESLRWQRQQKHNPLPDLKPSMLVRVLDAFEHGLIREAVLLWERIAERDDVLMSVKPKREKAVSQLDRQIVKLDDSPEADEHEMVLTDFWSNVRCYNSYDRNERGGFRRLVKQMMTAVSFRYAVHHIIWQPRPDGTLRATFEFVPLWQFENRTGRLRYLPNLAALEGTLLADGEWMTTVGDGLMIACCIGYLAKRSAYNDWLIFSEKFSVPGVMGRTTGRKGSPEGNAMRDAVESFGHDWTAVIYGDDGTHQEPLKLIQAAGNPSAMPMPAVIERVDRKFAALYRGADLSTMASNSGEGTGASLQEKESDILKRDDAEMIAETLEDISRMVIEWHFGHGTEPKARVELVVPVAEDAGKVIENGIKLAAAGASVSVSALMDRAGLPVAKDASDSLGAGAPKTEDRRQEQANAEVPEDEKPEWMDALADDMRPLGQALAAAMNAGDDAAVAAALRKLSDSLPGFMDTPGLEAWLEDSMTAALLGGSEDAENSGNSDGARKGWETRRLNGWAPAPRLITPQRADEELQRGFFVSNQAGERIRFGAELQRKLNGKVVNEADRNARKQRLHWAALAVEEGTSHSSKRHGNIRTVYAKTFRKEPKYQDVEVIVDTINGYAWNIMVKGGNPNAIR